MITNRNRAIRGNAVRAWYAEDFQEDEVEYPQDIITDLLHALRLEHVDVEAVVRMAVANFEGEIAAPPESII